MQINNGIPDGAATSTIREDLKRKGLLYAGTETQVYETCNIRGSPVCLQDRTQSRPCLITHHRFRPLHGLCQARIQFA